MKFFSLLLTSISLPGDKNQLFVRIWFWNFDHQNLNIALFVVSSFINGSIFLMENANPIFYTFFLIILLIICRCGRLYEIKEKKYSYNQCFLSATNELSLNLNNKFRSSLVQNINLYLLICQGFTEEIRFLISFKIRAHRGF